MIQPKSFIFIFLSILFVCISYAQHANKKNKSWNASQQVEVSYDNAVYNPDIKSISIYPIGKEGQFPAISLSNNEFLQISFDDLRGDIRSIYYSIEHCNADWKPSGVPSMNYIDGYVQDRVYSNQQSRNTLIPYTHYQFSLPNENLQFKIGGNYLLKVYEDANQSNLLFTSRFYVTNNSTEIEASIHPSMQSTRRLHNQKVNITLTTAYEIVNPLTTLQIHVFQNQRSDYYKIIKHPTHIAAQKIVYNHPQTLDFEGNNEFRTVDLRSVRNASAHVNHLKRDTIIAAYLNADYNTSKNNYVWQSDENGKSYIRNNDYDGDNLQSEYIYTLFSLKDSSNIEGDIYLVGGFNNYTISESNKLTYNTETKTWETIQLLKQGLYNYEYVLLKGNATFTSAFSGSFFDTENEYQILVYYRKPGTYWDEIIGFKKITTTNY